nr:retrovirus-related Pol polyprotein from transposon TNT 1-94 [Tanacetum cinerariifolium]
FACFLLQEEPKRVHQALKDPSWIEVMQKELLQFKMQKVWVLGDFSYGKRAIGTKWVFMNKKDERGIVVRNTARLVTQGHTQEEGIDYEEFFAPIAKIEAIRLFLAYATFMRFMMYQIDVKSTFLYGTIEEDVYVCQPLGFEDPHHLDKVYKVVKEEGIDYEEVFTPIARIEAIRLFLAYASFIGFMVYQMDVKSASLYGTIEEEGKIDQTLFIKRQQGDILLIQIYDDDIIFGSTNKDLCKAFEKLMKDKFQMSSMGELTFFLGLQVKQKKDGIFISQDKYVAEILRKFSLTDGKSASTPIDTKKPLLKDPNGEDADVHIYRSMIGSLMYLTSSRPDIMFAVCACSRFQVTPKASNLHAVKRIFRYLKGKPHLGLWYPKDLPFNLVAYLDSDYAGSSLDRKSTIGGCQFLGCRLISSQCKKQTVVATSSTEAEYVAAVVLSSMESLKRMVHVTNILSSGYLTTPQMVLNSSCLTHIKNWLVQNKRSLDARISMNLLQNLMDTCTTLTRRVEHLEQDKIAQALEITKLKSRVKKLERRNKASNLKRLKKVGSSQRIDTSDDTVMDDVSKQEGIIENIDADEDVFLEDAKDTGLEHVNKVLSMQDDKELEPPELQKVVEVVTTAKLITEVVTAASTTLNAATLQLTTAVALTLTTALSRRIKGVEPKPLKKQAQIEQDEKYARELELEAELNKNIDWDEVIDHVQRKQKEDHAVKRYQALKRKPQTEAQARKNMMIYLKNVAGFKMDYFKRMTYDDIRPIFEKKFNSNVAFLLKTKEQIDEEESRALKRLNESQEDKALKKAKVR